MLDLFPTNLLAFISLVSSWCLGPLRLEGFADIVQRLFRVVVKGLVPEAFWIRKDATLGQQRLVAA